jgi:hypothetical protein
MNRGTKIKYRDGPMETQYDGPSRYIMLNGTFKSSIPTQNPSQKKSRLFCTLKDHD